MQHAVIELVFCENETVGNSHEELTRYMSTVVLLVTGHTNNNQVKVGMPIFGISILQTAKHVTMCST